MTMRAFLVDDESLALKRLQRMLAATGRVEITGSTARNYEPEEITMADKLSRDPQQALARYLKLGLGDSQTGRLA